MEGGLFTVENMKLQFPFTNVDKKLNHFQVTLQKAYLHVVYWWQHGLGMPGKIYAQPVWGISEKCQ